jgi:biotin transport system substrate-specific component
VIDRTAGWLVVLAKRISNAEEVILMEYGYAERLKTARLGLYVRRESLSLAGKIGLALAFAAATGLAAQIRIPLPFSPVPVTGQTFAVLAAGVLLGRKWGGLSLVSYVALGAVGIPWFNGGGFGMSFIAGPTGGYLVGFIIAAFIIGFVVDKFPEVRGFWPMLGVMLAVNFVVIYGFGLIWLGVYLSAIKMAAVTLPALLTMGAVPFIAGDTLKAVLAALMAKTVTPKEDF